MAKITTSYKGDMLFESKMGNHSLVIDVPAGMGGSDRGPMPPQVFIASLGSCVGAMVADYCNRVGIDAEGMTVDVSFDKVPDPTRLTNLKITVNLPNGDCAKRLNALMNVAKHCPVHETIEMLEGIDFTILGKGECDITPEG